MAPDTCDAYDHASLPCFLAEAGEHGCTGLCAARDERAHLWWRLDEPAAIEGPAHLLS